MFQRPLLGNVDVLLRSIDLITLARPKALLWQARVINGATNLPTGNVTCKIRQNANCE